MKTLVVRTTWNFGIEAELDGPGIVPQSHLASPGTSRNPDIAMKLFQDLYRHIGASVYISCGSLPPCVR